MVLHGNVKRPKLPENASIGPKIPNFTSGNDIHAFLRSNGQPVALDGLKALRNQITLKTNEDSISTQDARLLLVKEWLEIAPGAPDVFALVDKGTQPAIGALCISVLSCVLSLTSMHFVYQPLGLPIIKKLLSSQWMRKMNSFLSGAHTDLCLATLKLLNAVSRFSGGKEQKALLEAFSWDVKVFHKLLYMRRKGKDSERGDMLAKPDIRTLAMMIILSFFSPHSSPQVKSVMLEQHRDVILSIFKGLSSDSYSVIRHTLEVLWSNLWQDHKVKRTLKIGAFGETTIQHLLKIYDRATSEGSDTEQIPADVVHHFLLAICTHRGVGICFADNGWYPRTEGDSVGAVGDEGGISGSAQLGGKVYNKILANALKTLKVNDDARQQELALKILQACPELVAGYLSSAGLTLEPRLSSKWLANIAFFGSIVSLPVPSASFLLPVGTASSSSSPAQYQPSPPPLTIIIENILPSVNLKAHLTKALQSTSALVQHSAALALAKCLTKCENVFGHFRQIEQALEEDGLDGQWSKRRRDVEKEIRKRVPDFQVIIAFANAYAAHSGHNGLKSALMAEISQRLLWLYHTCIPSLVAEARYDVGKSLQALAEYSTENPSVSEDVEGLNHLKQLHVLKMLKESGQFIWHARTGSSFPSNVHILLDLFVRTKHGAVRDAVTSLLSGALRDSLLFQHDPEELELWLDALPRTVRSPDAKCPDGTPLVDDREGVIKFLDDCMQRCGKTPYRYLEELDAFFESAAVVCKGDNADETPLAPMGSRVASPLMMTVLEQISAKVNNNTLVPSDALALMRYIRYITVSLLGNQYGLAFCRGIAKRLSEIVGRGGTWSTSSNITTAMHREIAILVNCINQCTSAGSVMLEGDTEFSPSDQVLEYVERAERFDNCTGDSATTTAYEIIDWFRLGLQVLDGSVLSRMAHVINRFHSPALKDFFFYLDPERGLLRALVNENRGNSDILSQVPFDWFLLHSISENFEAPDSGRLLSTVLRTRSNSFYSYKRYCGLILSRLDGGTSHPSSLENLVALTSIAKSELAAQDFMSLKVYLLSDRKDLQDFCCGTKLPDSLRGPLGRFVDQLLCAESETDCNLVSGICRHWTSYLLNMMENHAKNIRLEPIIWLKFMPADDILMLSGQALRMYRTLEDEEIRLNDGHLQLLEELFAVLSRFDHVAVADWSHKELPDLLALRLRHSSTVKSLENVIVRSIISGVPTGYDGFTIPSSIKSLVAVVDRAQLQWSSRLNSLPDVLSINAFLDQGDWSTDVSSAVASLIYRSSGSQIAFWNWLSQQDLSDSSQVNRLVPSIHACFDCCAEEFGNQLLSSLSRDFIWKLYEAISAHLFNTAQDEAKKAVAMSCLYQMFRHIPDSRAVFIKILHRETTKLSVATLHTEVLQLAVSVMRISLEYASFFNSVLDYALQWTVRHLSDNPNLTDLDFSALDELVDLFTASKEISPQFAEPVIVSAIHHHLLHTKVLQIIEILYSRTSLKPVNVNRHLQSILQHPHFLRVLTSEAREAVSKLLFVMFHAYPTNSCQPSHVQPLVQLYSGTLSTSDRHIFAIIRLFEKEKKASVASIFQHWSPVGPLTAQSFLDTLSSLEPRLVFKACLDFSCRRTLAVDSEQELTAERVDDGNMYDPIFVLLLFAQALSEGPPRSALAWVQLYRTNVVSLLIRCMSSAAQDIRHLAVLQLSSLWSLMQSADMQEKEQVLYVLNLLRDQLSVSPKHPPLRIASYNTLLLAHALRGIFYPSNFIYPVTARFLLQRPELDLHDVPMLYGLLYTSSDNWKKERAWIIRFLADGMQSSADWHLLKRRHTWDLLASLYQGSFNDWSTRHGILEVLANITCHSHAATSLILKSSLVQWMEMQLLTPKTDENIAWAKVIENLLTVVDLDKVDKATSGECQAGLIRCLKSLLRAADNKLLRLIARSMSRMTGARLHQSSDMQSALALAVNCLKNFETNCNLSIEGRLRVRDCPDVSLPPHRSHGLHQVNLEVTEVGLVLWGLTVENLMCVAMMCELKSAAWDGLSQRALIWRASVGEEGSSIGEWVRRQTLGSMWAASRN